MAKLTKIYNNAYLSADKDAVVKGLEELYSYLMTKYLEDSKSGTTLTKLYNDVTSFLKKKNTSDNPKSFESYASLLYSLESDWFTVRYPKISQNSESISTGYLVVVSESNKTYTRNIDPEDCDYILKLSDVDFKNAKNFFYSKVLALNTSQLTNFRVNVYWNIQSISNGSGNTLGFVKLVSPKNLEAYKQKASALLELANYIKRVFPDALDSEEQYYINYYFRYGYNKHQLRSKVEGIHLVRAELDSLDSSGKRYLQLLKDLGHVYEGDSSQGFKYRINKLTVKDVLGAEYPTYVQLCKRAGLIPVEFLSFS